jgi:hypothetical protein
MLRFTSSFAGGRGSGVSLLGRGWRGFGVLTLGFAVRGEEEVEGGEGEGAGGEGAGGEGAGGEGAGGEGKCGDGDAAWKDGSETGAVGGGAAACEAMPSRGGFCGEEVAPARGSAERPRIRSTAIAPAANAAAANAIRISTPGVLGEGFGTVGSRGFLSSARAKGTTASLGRAARSPSGRDARTISVSTERVSSTGGSGGGVGFPTPRTFGPPWKAAAASPFDTGAAFARRK